VIDVWLTLVAREQCRMALELLEDIGAHVPAPEYRHHLEETRDRSPGPEAAQLARMVFHLGMQKFYAQKCPHPLRQRLLECGQIGTRVGFCGHE
jgi:hypothetical protein